MLVRYAKYIDCYELRIDYLRNTSPQEISEFPRALAAEINGKKSILTFRRRQDGGLYTGTEQERLRYLCAVIASSSAAMYDYIDVECDVMRSSLGEQVAAAAHARAMTIIRSMHNMRGGAEQLREYIDRCASHSDEIPKVAVMIDSSLALARFMQELLQFRANNPDRAAIILGMGEYGIATRLVARKYGLLLSYCSVADTAHRPPGHISPEEMDMYQYHRINRDTTLFGIIGNPLAHSRSPAIHNRWFADGRHNAVYLPFLTDEVHSFIEVSHLLPLCGFSVTVPHKEAVVPHLATKSREVDMTGACNTVIRANNGLRGYNTDIDGFRAPLRDMLAAGNVQNALIIGAGGAARAVAVALLHNKCYALCIVNRTVSRGERLAAQMRHLFPQANITVLPLTPSAYPDMQAFDNLIVQTTHVGMGSLIADTPLPDYPFTGREVVYDLIYNPSQTVLLRHAKSAGCTIINGDAMFHRQAQLQSRYFIEAMTDG